MSTTFKINKNSNFTVMSNHHLRDKNLSLKAKGLLSYMLSLPDDWIYSLKGLVSICKENKDAIRASLNELISMDNNLKLICSFNTLSKPLNYYLKENLTEVLIVIGPQGGFSKKEEKLLFTNNFLPVSLEKRSK